MSKLRAEIRAQVFTTMDDPVRRLRLPYMVPLASRPPFISQEDVKQRLSNENFLINELIREYLEYNSYQHTLRVFLPGAMDASCFLLSACFEVTFS